MELGLVLVVLFSTHVLEAGSLIPGFYQKNTETYYGRREVPVFCQSYVITTAQRVAYPPYREFAWKTLIPTAVCRKSLKHGGFGKMAKWKLRQINKFNKEDLEFEVLSSGGPFGQTLILATGCVGTALFTLVVLFVCYRVFNCGRQIRTLLYGSEDELCGCFSNGKRRNHRKHRMTKDSSSSSAVIQMASLSSPVKLSPSLVASDLEVDSASPTSRCPGHFSFNEEDLRVGYQLMESLHKVDEAEGESQGYVTEEKTNYEGPRENLETDALLVNPLQEQFNHQHQHQDQQTQSQVLQQPPQPQAQTQQPQQLPAAAPATVPTPALSLSTTRIAADIEDVFLVPSEDNENTETEAFISKMSSLIDDVEGAELESTL